MGRPLLCVFPLIGRMEIALDLGRTAKSLGVCPQSFPDIASLIRATTTETNELVGVL